MNFEEELEKVMKNRGMTEIGVLTAILEELVHIRVLLYNSRNVE